MKGHVKTVHGIRRLTALHAVALSASASIGPAGGEIDIPSAGLRISIPEGALAETSMISIEAHPEVCGFTATMTPEQPFQKRIRVEQHVEKHHIDDAHTDPPFLVGLTDEIKADAVVTELYAGRVIAGKVVAWLRHLSGYLIATGNGFAPCDPADGNPDCVWVDDGK